ncbi:hypothetical protein J6590_008812 [Homalodisca vitripennis]|nr:hypothetical protein J6590_008812 [Homalodisca vitripennis]
MSQRKCFRDAAHNATPPPLPPITTHSRSRAQLKAHTAGSACWLLTMTGQHYSIIDDDRPALLHGSQTELDHERLLACVGITQVSQVGMLAVDDDRPLVVHHRDPRANTGLLSDHPPELIRALTARDHP